MADKLLEAFGAFEIRCATAEKNLENMPRTSLRSADSAKDTEILDRWLAAQLAARWAEGHKYAATEVLSGVITGLTGVLDAVRDTLWLHCPEDPDWQPLLEPTMDKSHLKELMEKTKEQFSDFTTAVQSAAFQTITTTQAGLQQHLARLKRHEKALEHASRFDPSYDLDSLFIDYKAEHKQAWKHMSLTEQRSVGELMTTVEKMAEKRMSSVLPQLTEPELDSRDAQAKLSRQANLLVLENWATWLQTSKAFRTGVTRDYLKKNVVIQF